MRRSLEILAAFGVVLAIVSFILYAIQKVRTGRGLDYYLTGHGVQMNYIGVLIAFGMIAIVLLIGWIVRFWSNKKRAYLEDGLAKKMLKKSRA